MITAKEIEQLADWLIGSKDSEIVSDDKLLAIIAKVGPLSETCEKMQMLLWLFERKTNQKQ